MGLHRDGEVYPQEDSQCAKLSFSLVPPDLRETLNIATGAW